MMIDLALKEDNISMRNEELTHENEKLIDLLYQRIKRF